MYNGDLNIENNFCGMMPNIARKSQLDKQSGKKMPVTVPIADVTEAHAGFDSVSFTNIPLENAAGYNVATERKNSSIEVDAEFEPKFTMWLSSIAEIRNEYNKDIINKLIGETIDGNSRFTGEQIYYIAKICNKESIRREHQKS